MSPLQHKTENVAHPGRREYDTTAPTGAPSGFNMTGTADPRSIPPPGTAPVGGPGHANPAYTATDNYTTANTAGQVAQNQYNAPVYPGPAPNTAGPHRSDLANKLDPRVDSKMVALPGPAPTTAGPHHSDTLNKLDPRVDSDMDGSRTFGHPVVGSHRQQGGTMAATSTVAAPGTTATGRGAPERTYGPHKSRLANALDPRVNSDADHRANAGFTNNAAVAPGSTTTTAVGNSAPEGTHGPHHSRLANVLDPRVDSDADNRGSAGAGWNATAAGTGAAGAPTGGQGPHRSRLANRLDPTVDSSGAMAPGPAAGTAQGAAAPPAPAAAAPGSYNRRGGMM